MTIPDMNPLGYTGLKQRTPANAVHYTRDPTTNDWQGFDIGDLWVNTTTRSGFQLMLKAKNPAPPHTTIGTWEPIAGGGTQVSSLQPDVGVAVVPTGGVINVSGGTNGLTTFLAAPSTLAINNNLIFTEDDTNVVPFVGGNINITGTIAQGVSTAGATGDVVITVQDATTAVKGVSFYDTNQFATVAGQVFLNGNASFQWLSAIGGAQALDPDSGWWSNNGAGLVTFSLPAVCPIDSVIKIAGFSAGGWILTQNALQVIHFTAAISTTIGVGGGLASTDQYDTIELLCTVPDTEFVCLNVKGNPTVI